MKEAERLSPNSKSREIVEFLTLNEYIGAKLHTAICHGLESKEIDKLYKLVKKEKNG